MIHEDKNHWMVNILTNSLHIQTTKLSTKETLWKILKH